MKFNYTVAAIAALSIAACESTTPEQPAPPTSTSTSSMTAPAPPPPPSYTPPPQPTPEPAITPMPTPPPDVKNYPVAQKVPGKDGFVISPYDGAAGYIDVRGFPPGTEVRDPYTGKIFLVP